jgi:crotonobetainyl-CoA:carnitine CoA-transferase CaiB-like acyl-CoA transferase
MATDMVDRPLAGMRVLEVVAGPMAAVGRQLAELGADVIRLEPDGGDAERGTGRVVDSISLDFVAANLGKRATLLSEFDRLIAQADILLEDRGGFDISALRARYPALVIVSLSPFGRSSPIADWAGSDAVYHALSGGLSRSGIPGREPLLPPGELATACAAVQATYVTLLCHYEALRSGNGDHVDFAILDGASQALDPGFGMTGSATAGVPASQLPRGRPEARMQYPIIPCRDGYVRLCVLAPRQWHGMLEWMGNPSEFTDPEFEKIHVRFASKTLIPAIAGFFADKARAELEIEGQRFGVPAAAVLDLDEALSSEQVVARKVFVEVDLGQDRTAPFPDGVLEIDGERMGIAGPPPQVESQLDWKPGPVPGKRLEAGAHPFSGLKVLDFGVIVVGAECGRLLGDMGADVIKVENPQFPDGSRQNRTKFPISPTFAMGHRNKRSLGVDLREPAGKALVMKLVAESDVVLSNFKGGTLKSLGLDYESLRRINPRIIVTDSSAFGPTGPWSKRMGYGPLVRASAGLTMQWAYPGEPGSFSDAVTVYPDHVAGRISVIGVIALLIRRLRTGEGGSVAVSQAEVMLSHMAADVAARSLRKVGGKDHEASENIVSRVLRCDGDDEWCVLTLREAADSETLDGLLAGEPVEDWFARRSAQSAMEALQAAGLPAAKMLRVADLPDFPHFRERHFYRTETHPHLPAPFTAEGKPAFTQRLPDPPDMAAPLLGEHTTDIARERLGLDPREVEALLNAGVLQQS